MAWYYGTYACGHEGRENITGPVKNRQWIADRKFEGLCYECYKAKLEADREDANAEAAEKTKEMGLPELTGTEKQVAWANTLRLGIINYIHEEIEDELTSDTERKDFARALEYLISTKTKASWYIDERSRSHSRILKNLIEEMPTLEEEAEQKFEQEIRAESAVYPENCEYNVPADIVVKDDEVSVMFEKNDTFRKIVKGLGYRWDGRWRKQITLTTGTAADRAAELGNKLLNAGFPISILDPDIRRKAIEADYEPECDRWILHRTKGDYKGWLVIKWQGKDDVLYQKARRLTGSRWSKPSVVVKPEYWQEVEEFADMLGFKISESARERIEEVKAIQASAKVVVPAEPKEIEHEDKLGEILKSSAEILDDLRDD